MSFSISRFLGFSDEEIVLSYRELQQISIIEDNINLESQNNKLGEVVSAR